MRPETVSVRQSFDGTVEAVDRSTVAAQIAGEVVEIAFDVHDYVPADEVIVRIDDTQARAALAEARARMAQARAALGDAELRFRRVRDLRERQAVSEAELDQAEAAYQAAEARLEAVRAAGAAGRDPVGLHRGARTVFRGGGRTAGGGG